MKTIHYLLIILSLSGCALLQQSVKTVDPAYLENMTGEEEETIASLEKKIIAKKNEIRENETLLQILAQKITLGNILLRELAVEKEYNTELGKLYNLTADSKKEKMAVQEVLAISGRTTGEELHLKKLDAEKDMENSRKELLATELSLLLAELEHNRARVGLRNQQNMQMEKSNTNYINMEYYTGYLKKIQNEYNRRKFTFQQKEALFLPLENKLKESGYKSEIK